MRREAILKENFAKRLGALRKKLNLSQEELVAELKKASNNEIDITRSALASYENRKSLPRLDVFFAIARYFGESMDTMLEPAGGAPKHLSGAPANEADLIHDLSIKLDALERQNEYYKREFEYYKSEFEKAIRPQKDHARESRTEFLRRMYNYPYWRNQFKTFLTDKELDIFYSIQNGQDVAQLAERLAIEPEEVERIYNWARDRVLAYFKK